MQARAPPPLCGSEAEALRWNWVVAMPSLTSQTPKLFWAGVDGWQLGAALPASCTEEVKHVVLCITNPATDAGMSTLEGVVGCSVFSGHLCQVLQPTFPFLFLPALDEWDN